MSLERGYTPARIGRMLKMEARAVRRWIAKGQLDAVQIRLGRRTMCTVSRRDLVSFLCENQLAWDATKCPDLYKVLGYKQPPFWITDAIHERHRHGPKRVATRGKAWTPEMEAQLETLIREGRTAKEIAGVVGRTPKAVKQRREKMGIRVRELRPPRRSIVS